MDFRSSRETLEGQSSYCHLEKDKKFAINPRKTSRGKAMTILNRPSSCMLALKIRETLRTVNLSKPEVSPKIEVLQRVSPLRIPSKMLRCADWPADVPKSGSARCHSWRQVVGGGPALPMTSCLYQNLDGFC